MQGDEVLTGEKAEGEREKKNFIWSNFRAERCPFGALPVLGYNAYHCDLCQGKPQCVKFSPRRLVCVKSFSPVKS